MLNNLYALVNEAETCWLGETAAKRRQHYVRALAKHFPGSNRKKARMIFNHLNRYSQARWQYDKDKPIVPEKYRNTRSELLFRLLKENNGALLQEERIRQILGVGEDRGTNSPTSRCHNEYEKSFAR